MPVKWNGPAALASFERQMGRRLDAARFVVQNRAKVLISVDGTGTRGTPGARNKQGRFLKRLVYGANPSKPGEPPHVQTGRLRASVASERTGMMARVGTNVVYGRWLELGTVDMAARPWLRRSLVEMTPAVRAILSAPLDV